jgi:DNA-binding response OmpR family regulator
VAHILVIDDDGDLCITMQEMLQAEGHKVSVAADGEQGIKLQRKQPASLLITGYEVNIGEDQLKGAPRYARMRHGTGPSPRALDQSMTIGVRYRKSVACAADQKCHRS